MSFNIDKKLIKIKELKKLFPDTNPDCFKPEKMFKMRDDLALQLFSKENIDILFEHPEHASAAIFWLLNFPLNLMLVKGDSY
jgi:hypothetical protein